MRKKSLLFVILLVGVIIGATGVLTFAESATPTVPGTADDPLITKSYLDEQVGKLVAAQFEEQEKLFNQQLAAQTADQVAKLQSDLKAANTAELKKIKESLITNTQELTVVTLRAGQQLIASAGAQLVVRNGKAVVFSTDKDGVSNLTSGKDLIAGQKIPTNHLLLVPRAGRGIQPAPDSKSDIIILVRGSFQLKKSA